MADELFAGFTPTPPTTTPKPPEETPVSTVSSDASSLLNFGASTSSETPQPAPEAVSNKAPEVSDTQLFTPKTETDTVQPTAPVVPVPDALLHMISDAEAVEASEVVTPVVPLSTTAEPSVSENQPIIPETPVVTSVPPIVETVVSDIPSQPDVPAVPAQPAPAPVKNTDPRLESFIKDDPIYQEMLRTVDAQRVRLSLALRYALLMFGIFLVFAWIVNNRVIMFGFSEFVWLARIRDGLFGLMAGLFSATLWYGSPVWFHNIFFVMVIRVFAFVFFLWVLSALYFPIV